MWSYILYYTSLAAALGGVYMIGRTHGYAQCWREIKKEADTFVKEHAHEHGIGAYQTAVPGACKPDNGDIPVAKPGTAGAALNQRAENR